MQLAELWKNCTYPWKDFCSRKCSCVLHWMCSLFPLLEIINFYARAFILSIFTIWVPNRGSRIKIWSYKSGSLSSDSVDGAMNQATCLRDCCDLSHQLSVGKPKEFPSSCAVWMENAASCRNWKIFFTTTHGILGPPRLVSASNVFST